MVKVSCAFVGLDTFYTHHRRTASAPPTPARHTSVPRCTSPPPSTYHTLSLEPTTLYLNDYPSEKSPMHLQQGEHLTLTNFQRLYLYTSDSFISFPVNRHVRLHKLLGQPSNLEDDPKTIGFSQIYEECWKRGHFSFPGYRGDSCTGPLYM